MTDERFEWVSKRAYALWKMAGRPFSVPEGQIKISLAADEELTLTWTETGGPPILAASESTGFGSQLERTTVESSLRGSLTRQWRPEGLRIELRIPLENLIS
jgi:two-component sensor histidine kinase